MTPTWHQAAIRHPRRTLVVTAFVVAVAAAGLPGLDLQVDGRKLAPENAPEVRDDHEIRARFGVREPIAIVVSGDTPDAAIDPRVLGFVDAVTRAWIGVDTIGPDHVTSLATEKSFRQRADSLKFRGLLEAIPDSREALAQWHDDVERIGLYRGTLLADDGSATAIVVGLPDDADRLEGYRRAHAIVAAHPLPGFRVDVLGAPIAEALLGHHVLDDLGVPRAWLDGVAAHAGNSGIGMVPAALVIIGAVLFIALRRVWLVALALGLVGSSLVVVLGVMGWVGAPIYLTLAVMPVLLTALGVADAIHVLMRLQDLARDSGAIPDLVRASLDELAPPIVRTSWTTAAALVSFTVSPLGPVRAFGGWSALGVVVLMLGALTTLPAALCLLPSSAIEPPPRGRAGRALHRGITELGLAASRHRMLVWAVVLAVVLIAGAGVHQVRVHDSWLDGFAADSPFARATQRFEARFAGTHRLLVEARFEAWRLEVEAEASTIDHHTLRLALPSPWPNGVPRDAERWVGARVRARERPGAAARHDRSPRAWRAWVEAAEISDGVVVIRLPRHKGSPKFWLRPAPGDLLDITIEAVPFENPAVIRRVAALERFLGQQPGVGGVLGPARYLETTAFMMAPDTPDARRLPATPDAARTLWHNYGVVRGAARLGQWVTAERDRALIATYLRGSNFTDTEHLVAALENFASAHITPAGGRLTLAGDVAVSQALIGGVVRTQTLSLALSLFGIGLTAALVLRSWRLGLLCVAPSAVVVWLDFALLGWSGIPLGVATSMFAGMTLGVGVDYCIHLLARYQHARDHGITEPAADALWSTAPALLTNATAVGVGFAVLLLSQVPGNARLGLLLLASVVGCLVLSLVLVPTAWPRQTEAQIDS